MPREKAVSATRADHDVVDESVRVAVRKAQPWRPNESGERIETVGISRNDDPAVVGARVLRGRGVGQHDVVARSA
ncbi:hypothetical protein [Streptomyces sp. NPDC060002]|uniref:hypothetical protein n=1 Tax=Streptomyces sp. NPDC060002 TaxID=3347033 RepID=UPI0036A53D7A